MVRRMHPEWTSPFVFRRQLIRTNLPSCTGTATGVHYDHIFLRDGPPTALTAWVPIGDCSPINGGLMYLEDSVGVGQAIEEEFTRQGQEKGFSKEDATYAFNSNVSVRFRAIAQVRGRTTSPRGGDAVIYPVCRLDTALMPPWYGLTSADAHQRDAVV
jgi:hypothetical protein